MCMPLCRGVEHLVAEAVRGREATSCAPQAASPEPAVERERDCGVLGPGSGRCGGCAQYIGGACTRGNAKKETQ